VKAKTGELSRPVRNLPQGFDPLAVLEAAGIETLQESKPKAVSARAALDRRARIARGENTQKPR
jgi:hypothetical protein